MLFLASSAGAQAQYNVDYKMGEYSDPQTIESNVDIGKDEIITVGTLRVNEFAGSHDDVILTRLDQDGNIIWNIRYGTSDYDEVGNGITLSWDEKHVIVVGSIQEAGFFAAERKVLPRQALVLKIRISDGAVVWTTTYGIEENDDQAFLVKRSNSEAFEDLSYVIVGTSMGDPEQFYERMYAFKIKESGDEIWQRRYYLSYDYPITSIRPTSMVENEKETFMIAGTRTEIGKPTQLFTIGIKTINGDVSHDLFDYPTDNIYHVSRCDIDRQPDGKGYALAFTADDFKGDCIADIIDTDTDRIGVIRLNEDRKVLWASVYWEKEATNQDGLSVRFYKDELHVCININRASRFNTAGILRLKEASGGVIACTTYHIPESRVDYGPIGNHMIRNNDDKEYYVKSIYPKWGFSMVNTDILGKANCSEEAKINSCEYKTEPKAEKCEAKKYGKYKFWKIPTYKVDYGMDACKEIGLAPESQDGSGEATSGSLPTTQAIIYPSPVSGTQELINLKFITELDKTQGNIRIFNSMGQEVVNYDLVLVKGENKFTFDAKQFNAGIYLVMISADDQILDRVKFIKN